MSALGNPQIGAAALVAGSALVWATWGLGDGTGVTAAGAVAIGGGVQGLVGLALWHRERRGRLPTGGAHRSAQDIDMLLCAMVAVAALDRSIAEGEVSIIEDVTAGLLGQSLPRARIERAFRQMRGGKAIDLIARKARQVTPEGAELAVKGAVWAGRADGALTSAESRLIGEIAAALDVSGHRLRQCIAEADHVHERLAQAGPA